MASSFKKPPARKATRARASTPKTSTTDHTREALLAAAKHLFAQKGYDGVSVKELADHAKVNVSLVSYHFQGKEGLYRACLSQFGHERLAAAERILVAPQSREEFQVRLRMFIDEMLRCHVEEPELGAIVHREAEQLMPRIPDIFQATFLKVFENACLFLQAAQRRKFLRAEVDAQLVTTIMFGSVFHFTRCDHIAKRFFGNSITDARHRAKVAEHVYRVILNGVEAP